MKRQMFDIFDNGRYLGSVSVKTRATTQRGIVRAVRGCQKLYLLGVYGWRNTFTVSRSPAGLVIHV